MIKDVKNNMNKVVLLLVLSIFLLANVSAKAPSMAFINSDNLIVDTLIYETIKQQQDFNLHIHAYNATTGLNLSNGTTNCNFHLYNSSGNHILRVTNMLWNGQGDWETVISGGNFTNTGSYAIEVWCTNGAVTGGSERIYFEVTPNGTILDTSQAIVLSLFVLFAILILFFSLYSLVRIPEETRESNTTAWKILYMCISYVALFVIFFVGWIFATDYLWAIPILSSVFWIIWLTLAICFWPFIISVSAYILYKESLNKLTENYVSEGYSRRDALAMAKRRKR